MKASKLFHVLVLAGGALAAGCSSESEPTPHSGQSASSTTTGTSGGTAPAKGDAGTAEESSAPVPDPGGGSHFW